MKTCTTHMAGLSIIGGWGSICTYWVCMDSYLDGGLTFHNVCMTCMYSTHGGLYLEDPSHCSAHGSISFPDAISDVTTYILIPTYVLTLSAGGIAGPSDHTLMRQHQGRKIHLATLKIFNSLQPCQLASHFHTGPHYYVTPINLQALEPFPRSSIHPPRTLTRFPYWIQHGDKQAGIQAQKPPLISGTGSGH